MAELRASLTAMNAAATHWGLAADHLTAASRQTSKLHIPVREAGTFTESLKTYLEVPDYFRDRFNEGATVFDDIATALNNARRQYEATDAANQGKLHQLEGEIND
ncbi:hypothetical protein [Nocardia carnea]|uniref:ESX-1 secretion-associated protein n=1 Tax=Nocardia carnea TaxID=37328 RepID=A0ABW7TR43_9NOCA|nr:hypothetical protein [Nocardia carnea]